MSRAGAQAVRRAFAFLARRQLPHGEFASYRHGDRGLAGPGRIDSSPFVTTLVLHALDFVDDPRAPALRARAAAFLESEREPPGVWRYWTSRNGAAIDPDLDDTCCASFALRDRAPLDNHGAIIGNRHPSGLFKTWLREPAADNDVEGAVNANVLLYLGERAETRAARDIVVAAINDGREASGLWYYLDALSLHFFVARAFLHGVAGFAACRDAVAARLDAAVAGAASPLAVGLALCTMLSFGIDRAPARQALEARLIDAQAADGCWIRSAFYAGPEPPGPHAAWWGSEELTTAVCLEALARMNGGA